MLNHSRSQSLSLCAALVFRSAFTLALAKGNTQSDCYVLVLIDWLLCHGGVSKPQKSGWG